MTAEHFPLNLAIRQLSRQQLLNLKGGRNPVQAKKLTQQGKSPVLPEVAWRK